MSLPCVCVWCASVAATFWGGVKGIYPRHILAGDQVAIDIDCDLNASVPHLFLDVGGRDAGLDQKRAESALRMCSSRNVDADIHASSSIVT